MKHGRQRWILISLAFVLFCSCSKLEAQELDWGQVDFSREVVESAAARGVSVVEGYKDWTFNFEDGQVSLLKTVYSFDYDQVMRSVNHRGFSATAPENTLPAYRLSRLEEYGLKGKAKYISFNASLLEYALAKDPDACVGFLTGRVDARSLDDRFCQNHFGFALLHLRRHEQ